MKSLLSIPALLLFCFVASGQSFHNIRFIYAGEETKPVGTLSISVEKIIKPRDRPLDSIFGKAVKTDIHSFELVANYIKESRNLHPSFSKIGNSDALYQIVVAADSTEKRLFLLGRDFRSFFEPLKALLKSKCDDSNLVEAFNYY